MSDRTIEPDPHPAPEIRTPPACGTAIAASTIHAGTSSSARSANGAAGPWQTWTSTAASHSGTWPRPNFGGHPYTTHRAENAWIREGLVRESRAKGPKGKSFKLLTLTCTGAAAVRDLATEYGLDPPVAVRVRSPPT